MTQRMLNMIQGAEEGIKLARQELKGPGALNHCKDTLRHFFLDTEPESMSIRMAAYLACMLMYWGEAGSPDLYE